MNSPSKRRMENLAQLNRNIVNCDRCPRLLQHCQRTAREKVRRYRDQDYWGRPVPSLGKSGARLYVVGLAPAAHGGNRTGRVFTGDKSGDWVFRALYTHGFANQPQSTGRRDGLVLRDCYITAAVHCAPPQNKPEREEFDACRAYLVREIQLLSKVRVVVALGQIAFRMYLKARREAGQALPVPSPKFGHGVCYDLGGVFLFGSYHPSQQNTFTGRLTKSMFHSVFRKVRRIVDRD